MKFFFSSLFFILLAITKCAAQYQKTLSVSSAPGAEFRLYDIHKYANDDFLVVGGYYNPPESGFGLAKFNSSGDTLWTTVLYDSLISLNSQYFSSAPTIDGGCVVFSSTYPTSYIVAKLGSSGNLDWSRSYHEYSEDTAVKIIQTRDSGFVFIALTGGELNPQIMFFAKANNFGDTLWLQQYRNESVSRIFDIEEDHAGNLFIAGEADFFRGFVMKTDSAGNFLWLKKFTGLSHSMIIDLSITPSNSLLMSGFDDVNNTTFILETDTSASLITSVTFPANFGYSWHSLLTDNSILLNGIHQDTVTLAHIDSQFNFIWEKKYSVHPFPYLYNKNRSNSVVEVFDGNLLFVNAIANVNVLGWLAMTDSTGISGCGEGQEGLLLASLSLSTIDDNVINYAPRIFNVDSSGLLIRHGMNVEIMCSVNMGKVDAIDNSFKIVPNPASTSFSIYDNSQHQSTQIVIQNLLGEIIFSVVYREPLTVNCEHFPPGIYFVSLQNEKGSSVQKLIKQ